MIRNFHAGQTGMRALVGVRCLIQPKTGIGHYTEELLQALRAHPDAPQIATYPGPMLLKVARKALDLGKSLKKLTSLGRAGQKRSDSPQVSLAGPAKSPLSERVYEWLLDRELRSKKYDFYHEPNYFAQPCDLPTIVTVCDLSALIHPQWHPADRVRRHEQLFRWLVPSGAHFLTISRFVSQEMQKYLGIHPSRIHVTCCGVRNHLRPLPAEAVKTTLARLGLPSGYFLHVGTIEPRKNLGLLLRAWADLPDRVRTRHPLVLAGGIGWKETGVLDLMADLKPKGLFHLGYIDDADLPALYGGARALVYPSHYEGFGMPPVEMLACGGVVLAAPAGAVEEVASPSAHILRSQDPQEWRDAMLRLAVDDDWHAQLASQGIETASRHTWQRCADLTISGYQKLMGQSVELSKPGKTEKAA